MSGNPPPFFEDLTKLAGGAMGTMDALRRESETWIKNAFEKKFHDMNLATQEDVSVLKNMLIEARLQQDAMEKRLSELEELLKSDQKDA